MDYNELLDKIDSQIKKVDVIKKQINLLQNIKEKKHLLIKEEVVVTYDAAILFDDFSFKMNQALFFLKKYLESFKEILLIPKLFDEEFISTGKGSGVFDEMLFYFDAFIPSISNIIEGKQKDILLKYLKSKNIEKIYPSRNKFGLWWQIYMLRNRIIHTTDERYDENKGICSRYMEFSPRIIKFGIQEKKITFQSTLLDIYKDKNIKSIIEEAIKDWKTKPFEELFPCISAKGEGRDNPQILYIDSNIYFDYATSGSRLIDETLNFFILINHEFLVKFSEYYNDKNEIYQIKTLIGINEQPYTVNDNDLIGSDNHV